MRYYFAPMEGVTDMVFRRTHQKYYPGIDRYYTPFVSPTQNHFFTPRQVRELCPENNAGVPLVPQLLGKNAEDVLWAIRALADWGYEEVNLNLGCPSGTVTAKGKGAGMLANTGELDSFLNRIFQATPIRLSIKTRIGVARPEEFFKILEIYNRYPLSELIIHPRTKAEQYGGSVHLDVFQSALCNTVIPLCYNGDVFTAADCGSFSQSFPGVGAVMLGRGLLADPALVLRLRGGMADKKTMRAFHNELCRSYVDVFGCEANAMQRMKAIWSYLLELFDGGLDYRRSLIKAKRWPDFVAVTDEVFDQLELLPSDDNLT